MRTKIFPLRAFGIAPSFPGTGISNVFFFSFGRVIAEAEVASTRASVFCWFAASLDEEDTESFLGGEGFSSEKSNSLRSISSFLLDLAFLFSL